MIGKDELIHFGTITKPHGLDGEVNLLTDFDVDIDLLKRVVMDVDGIYVPFFIESLRPKGATTLLVRFDGIDSVERASGLTGHTAYLLKKDNLVDDDDDGRLYLSDLIGFNAVDDKEHAIGEIVDVDYSTENTLFVIETAEGEELLVPAVDDFIQDIDVDGCRLTLLLPPGLADLS